MMDNVLEFIVGLMMVALTLSSMASAVYLIGLAIGGW